MAGGTKEIMFPMAGENQSLATQSAPPYTAYRATNVTPRDPGKERLRGGSRAGLVRFAKAVSAHPITLLQTGVFSTSDKRDCWEDTFEHGSLSHRTVVTNYASTVPSVDNGFAYTATTARSFIIPQNELSDFNHSGAAYTLGIYLVPYQGAWAASGTFELIFATAGTADYNDCCTAKFTIAPGGIWAVSLVERNGGTPTTLGSASGDEDFDMPGWFEVRRNGSAISVLWRDAEIVTGTLASESGAGLAVAMTAPASRIQIGSVRLQYDHTGFFDRQRSRIVTVQNGVLCRDTWIGHMASVGSSLTIASDRITLAAPFGNKIHIADTSEKIASFTDGVISGGNTFDSATYAAWQTTLASYAIADLLLVITTEGASAGNYLITAINTGGANTLTITGGVNGTGLSGFIMRGPKVYDVTANTLTLWTATAGTIPVGCSIVCTHLGRTFLAGDPSAPNIVYATATGDPFDWAFGSEPGDAFESSSGNLAGIIQGGVTALISYADSFLLIGTATSIIRMAGDPTSSGSMLGVSRIVGILSSTAWCYGEKNGQVFVLTRDGLYVTQLNCPGCELERLAGNIPQQIKRLNPAQTRISMAYDVKKKQVHIGLTPVAGSAATMPQPTHWVFDVETKGYFRRKYASNNHSPTLQLWYAGLSADDDCVLLAGFGGDLLREYEFAETDEGQTITNSVLLGPFKLGRGSGREGGILNELRFSMATYSAALTYRVYAGASAEAALAKYEAGTYDWEGTISAAATPDSCDRPMVGGGYCFIELIGGVRPWAMESITALVEATGVLT